MVIVEAKKISKSYSKRQVLREVNFVANKGEMIAILGDSGAGKSTLLYTLSTLTPVDSGEVIFMGQALSTYKSLHELRNTHIGFVFQSHHLLPEFTVLENVCLPAYIAKKAIRKVKEEATALLVELGLKDQLSQLPSQLSGGEAQRTAVARALINSPTIVYADEPSGNLDSKNASLLHELFLSLSKTRKQTFVIVTHNETWAKAADRSLRIVDGKLL